MMGVTGIPQNPQAAMARRPKPEDAASYITVRHTHVLIIGVIEFFIGFACL